MTTFELWSILWIVSVTVLALIVIVLDALRKHRSMSNLHRNTAGREAQRQAWQDTLDAERQAAARWVSEHCFWKQP